MLAQETFETPLDQGIQLPDAPPTLLFFAQTQVATKLFEQAVIVELKAGVRLVNAIAELKELDIERSGIRLAAVKTMRPGNRNEMAMANHQNAFVRASVHR